FRRFITAGSLTYSHGRSAMPRSARASAGGCCYDVINQGNARGCLEYSLQPRGRQYRPSATLGKRSRKIAQTTYPATSNKNVPFRVSHPAARTADAKAEAWLEEYNQAKRTTYPPAI